MESLVAPIVNVLILIVFLVYKVKGPTREFVAQRHVSIRDEIHSVREQLRQSQEKYDEFSSKLKAIDAEITVLREQSKQDSLAIKQRVVNEARRIAASIVSDAENTAEGIYADLKSQLYYELVNKVLDQVESLVSERLTGDDRVRIRQEFSQQMESIQ